MSNPYPPDIIDRLAFETIAHPSESLSDQAKLRVVLISIPDEVTQTIHELRQLQFAEVKI